MLFPLLPALFPAAFIFLCPASGSAASLWTAGKTTMRSAQPPACSFAPTLVAHRFALFPPHFVVSTWPSPPIITVVSSSICASMNRSPSYALPPLFCFPAPSGSPCPCLRIRIHLFFLLPECYFKLSFPRCEILPDFRAAASLRTLHFL